MIAKLDRLARNVHFVSGLIESGVDFVAADMPQANKTMIQMHAVMSEWERDAISKRTKEALTAAKARGVKLGIKGPENLRMVNDQRHAYAQAHADKLRGVLEGFKAQGLSQRAMLAELNALGIKPARGEAWHLQRYSGCSPACEATGAHQRRWAGPGGATYLLDGWRAQGTF